MKVKNPFKMNDWDIKSFLIVIFSIQLIMWGAIGLDLIGLKIPILRQLIGFLYLTLVPGFLILRILNLHKMNTIETLMYTIGLSLSILMILGFLINILYPHIGISKPISFTSLIITISVFILFLCILCYIKDKNFSNPSYIITDGVDSPIILFFLLIPFLSVIGTYFVNYHKDNLLLMIMIFIISLIVLLIGYSGYIPEKLYPFLIWLISISLIWHVTLISSYINIGDIVNEYHYADTIVKNSYWDWNVIDNYNSVLSIVMLLPIYCNVMNLELTWVFKIVTPFLFSFIPLGVYSVFLNETEDTKISFLSSVLFIEILPFIFQIPLIAKQSIAEIYLILLYMLLINKNTNVNGIQKATLSIIFSMSLIVSHYAISYIFMIALFFIWFLSYLKCFPGIRKLLKKINFNLNSSPEQNNLVSLTFLILFFTFTLSWYIYVSGSSSLHTVANIWKHIVTSIYTDFLDPNASRGLYMITRSETSFLRFVTKLFYIISQFFILVGFSNILYGISQGKKLKFGIIYFEVSIFFLIILFFAIFVSGFAVMDPRRLYHLSLFVLSPFCIIGGLRTQEIIVKILTKILNNHKKSTVFLKSSLNFMPLFLSVFLLLNTGFIFEIAKDHPNSISISQETSLKYGTIEDKAQYYGNIVVTYNVFSGKWLGKNMKNSTLVYRGDLTQGYPSLNVYGGIDPSYIRSFDNSTKEISSGYVQLSYANIVDHVGSSWYNPLQKRTAYNFSDIVPLFYKCNKIYNNGGSEILNN